MLGRRTVATAVLQEDPLVVAEIYQGLIAEFGLAKARRRLGIRINGDQVPTYEELVDASRREHLSVLHLDVGSGQP